ncbi:MAG: cell division protein FtsA, partial [Patescibacteria group bacterium]
MRKDLQPLIAGLDIGSSAIRIAIGQIANRGDGEENSELQILGASSVPSAGVNKGVINSIEDVVSSVSACLEGAERMVGAPIDSAWVAISGL